MSHKGEESFSRREGVIDSNNIANRASKMKSETRPLALKSLVTVTSSVVGTETLTGKGSRQN